MLRKIYYSERRRITGEGAQKGEKTRRYRQRKADGAPAKGRKREEERERDNVKALSRRAFLTSVDCLL
jgi:hypothetical protein